ncbi:MAG: hypothetical protein PVG71_08655 [Anaerolineae bacterium]|jgi:hypothetical protein
MNTLQAAQSELDRFFGPRQVNRNLICDALAGASHIFVHTYDDHRVIVKKRGSPVDTPLSPVVQDECQRLIEQGGRSALFRLMPRSGKNGARLHWLSQPKRLTAYA